MLLLFLSVFIMEDSIMPSARISALGSDFALLVEDPLTDIQFDPAKVGNIDGLSIYCKPQLGPNAVTCAILSPQIFRNVGIGLWGRYAYHSYTTALMDGTSIHDQSYPAANFFLVFPFLKDGSFFGLKFTIKQPQTEYSYGYYNLISDTNYFDSDTSMYQYVNDNSYGNEDKTTLWSIRGGQYLNFEKSAVEITASISHSNAGVTDYDSVSHEYMSTNIDHYDSVRTLYSSQDLYENCVVNIENYDIWSYTLGMSWIKELPVGRLKLFLKSGLNKGEITGQEFNIYRNYSEYRCEYMDPDTSYSYVDTIINEEKSEENSISGDINRDNEVIGIGFEKPIDENINFLIGLRLRRDHTEITKIISDTVKTTNTYYKASLPVGAEFFITKKICLRGGVTAYFSADYNEESNTNKNEIKNKYLSVTNSFGLGIIPIPRLKINMYVSGFDIAKIDNWELEAIYNF
jgi:hypothetical protein